MGMKMTSRWTLTQPTVALSTLKVKVRDRYRCDHTTGGLVHGIGGIIMIDEAEGTA